MNLKLLSLAAALCMSAPAFAITVNMTDFSFPAAPDVAFDDSATGIGYDGQAGRFSGTLVGNVAPSTTLATQLSVSRFTAQTVASTSFTAYCVEITQSFSFGTDYVYDWVSGATFFSTPQKAIDMSRLFTAAAGFVVDNATSAAMQAAIWEVEYEQGGSYDLTSGQVTVLPQDSADASAFAAMNVLLGNLAHYDAGYRIDVLSSPDHQDFLVATIPEPGTWALMAAGLGLLGLAGRRRARRAASADGPSDLKA